MLPYEHIIIIDPESKLPVYRQIAIAIIDAVRDGLFRPGMQLPSSRDLSLLLQVHRKTVLAAYEELEIQGWITTVPRKYVKVAEHIPELLPRKWSAGGAEAPYANCFPLPFRAVGKENGPIAACRQAEIVINDGYPDVRLSPIGSLLKTYRSLASRNGTIRNTMISVPQGVLKLREALAAYLSLTRGIHVSAAHILITHGAQMSIYLSARLLLAPGMHIIVGRPNYLIANKAFEEAGAKVIEVNVDEKGIDTHAIERICRRKAIKAVYVIPHHHYPTTVTLAVERRMHLLELSKQYSFVIMEDDYDYDYHYSSSPYLPLASGRHNGNVIYIGSFSKMLDPALRIGFMVAPENFIAQCTALRKLIDVGGDGYLQHALALLIKEGELKRHLNKAKKSYRERRDLLLVLLEEKLGDRVSCAIPSGGMAVWVKLNAGFSIAKLAGSGRLELARWEEQENAFRFGFASLNEKEMIHTVDLLSTVLDQCKV